NLQSVLFRAEFATKSVSSTNRRNPPDPNQPVWLCGEYVASTSGENQTFESFLPQPAVKRPRWPMARGAASAAGLTPESAARKIPAEPGYHLSEINHQRKDSSVVLSKSLAA